MSSQFVMLNETDLIVLRRLCAAVADISKYSNETRFAEARLCASVLVERMLPVNAAAGEIPGETLDEILARSMRVEVAA